MLVINVLADIFHIISIFLLCKLFLKFNLRNSKNNKKTIPMLILCLSIGIYFLNDKIVESIIYVVTIVLILYIIYDEKICNILVSGLWIITIIGMLDTMSIILFETLGKMIRYYNDDVIHFCASMLTFIFAFILCNVYYNKYGQGIQTISIHNVIAFTILTGSDTAIVMLLAAITRLEDHVTNMMIFFVTFILVILGLFLQLGAVILILMQRNIYKESQQLTEKYLEEQKNHYEYLEKRETETKKFRHDLRSHMEMLSVLAKERRYDEFDKYVEEINLNIDRFGNNVTVQNGIVDAIINKYYSEAVANEVNMEVKGRFPSDCRIDAYHLCTIFSNILSNALEATVEAGKKWISVECRYTDDNILVVVKNTFDNKNTIRNGKTRTHKQDTNNHGFGLENVKDSIRKYNGLYVIDTNEDIYTITISFNYIRQE